MTNMTTFAQNKSLIFPVMAQAVNTESNQIKPISINGFTKAKVIAQTKDLSRKIRITFYRTKPGCYSPAPYQIKCRKLSDVLK